VTSSASVRILLCCATRRGLAFLDRLSALVPEAELAVASFPERDHEPRFLAGIRTGAEARGARFLERRRLTREDLETLWPEGAFDLLLAVSWRYLIPPEVFRRARLGAFLFHDSLLPAYRGFSPTVWSMVNGEPKTGVTLCRMEEAVDSGEVLDQRAVTIDPDETIAQVMERVTETYLEILEGRLPELLAGRATGWPQDPALATYCCPRLPEDNRIDWTAASRRIHDLIRAVTHPYPGAYTSLDGERLRVWAARRVSGPDRYIGAVPGRVVAASPGEGSIVLTGDGALRVTRIQLGNEPECDAESLLVPFVTLGSE
jgi:methionyl-tRNA formyltransferase